MHRTILVAATPDDAGRAALTLGAELARPIGAGVVLVGVATGRYDMPEDEDGLSQRLAPLLEAAPGDIPVSVEVCSSDSVMHGLDKVVDEHDASILVLGPSHRSLLSRAVTEDVAVAAESGASCAVAVAPAVPMEGELKTIGVAWDESPEADEALEWAVQLAERTGATLQIIRVLDARHREGTTPEAGTEERVKAVAAAACARAEAKARMIWGDAPDELLSASHDVDLLVAGSRPHGVLWREILGGTSTRLVHEAHCPVVIIPPGVHAPADTAAV